MTVSTLSNLVKKFSGSAKFRTTVFLLVRRSTNNAATTLFTATAFYSTVYSTAVRMKDTILIKMLLHYSVTS